jgi:Trk-type K+ transport system membrane component
LYQGSQEGRVVAGRAVDTGTYWSGFGEGVILVLFQIGGFGIMTMASLLGLLISGKLRLRMQLTAQAQTKSLDIGDVRRVLLGVAGCTPAVELAVGALLALRLRSGYTESIWDAAYLGFSHAVSAFNNAGFGLHADNLTKYAQDPWVTLPIAVAVILGEIGFPVLLEHFVWAGAFTGALLTVGMLSAANGLADPLHALLVLCALAALLGVCARFAVAPGTAAVCWLFLNGFAVPPQGKLAWQGYPDAGRLAFLLVAALLGTVIARLVNARSAYRRITPGGERDASS